MPLQASKYSWMNARTSSATATMDKAGCMNLPLCAAISGVRLSIHLCAPCAISSTRVAGSYYLGLVFRADLSKNQCSTNNA